MVRVVVIDPGSGYCNPPMVVVEGLNGAEFVVKFQLDKDLKKNGSIASIVLKSR